MCLVGNTFLKIRGKCISRLSNFFGQVNEQPAFESNVIIECTYSGNYMNCKCQKKKENHRVRLKRKLANGNQSAAYVQRTEAMSIMKYGDKEPSHLPSKNALRLIKYKALKEDQLSSDPILALSLLKSEASYKEIIRDIAYDKFFVHYWATTEINSYRMYAKNSNISRITIDATGGVVKRLNLISGRQTSNIFLYQIGINDAKYRCQFSVGHMLSEKHDHNTISYWLSEWVRSNKITSPKIIVTDQSLALMMAVTKSFTQYSHFNKYINVCSSLILKNPEIEIPTSTDFISYKMNKYIISCN